MADKERPPVLNGVYKDAVAIFGFQPEPVQKVLTDGFIVLDTNALLTPYGTGKATLDQIEKTYAALIAKQRLVVPGQAAREFAKHRPLQLIDLYKAIGVARDGHAAAPEYHLLAEMDDYKKLREADREVAKALKARADAARSLLDKISAWTWNDPVSLLYRKLFDASVVLDPPVPDNFNADLEYRNANKIPPGFEDAGKDDPSGDLLIWHTILHLAREKKNHVMFVTGEKKKDWWHRTKDVPPLYPRFELLEEFRRESKGKTFHIMDFPGFLEASGAKPEVVDEVRNQTFTTQAGSDDWRIAALLAVHQWLPGSMGWPSPPGQSGFPNFWVDARDGHRIAVEVKLVGKPELLGEKLEKARKQSKPLRVAQKSPFVTVFVARSLAEASRADALLRNHFIERKTRPVRFKVVVGYLNSVKTFVEFSQFEHWDL